MIGDSGAQQKTRRSIIELKDIEGWDALSRLKILRRSIIELKG